MEAVFAAIKEKWGRFDFALRFYLTLLSESHEQLLMNLESMTFFDPDVVSRSILYLSAYSAVHADGYQGLLRLIATERDRSGASLVILDGLFALDNLPGGESEFRRVGDSATRRADVRVMAGGRLSFFVPAREPDDRCPNEAEDYDGFQDSDGCFDPARPAPAGTAPALAGPASASR